MKSAASATSSGCSILANASGGGGSGRFFQQRRFARAGEDHRNADAAFAFLHHRAMRQPPHAVLRRLVGNSGDHVGFLHGIRRIVDDRADALRAHHRQDRVYQIVGTVRLCAIIMSSPQAAFQ